MGEAKRRKEKNPNFGSIPERPSRRGLVISPPIEIAGTSMFVKSSNLDPQELRFALLFWDQLVWPSSRAVYFASGPDEEYLESAGILKRPDYTFNGDAAQGIALGQIQAFFDLDKSEPGTWALAQGENSLLLKASNLLNEEGGALVELHRAIPIPSRDVPLAEILEFKQRRHDELILLRLRMESFVMEIQGSQDKLDALQKCIKEIDQACADLLKLGKEWQFPVHLSDFKATFSLSPLKFLPAVAAGWKLGEKYGLSAATAAAVGAGAVSTLEIKADWGLQSVRKPMSPYRYAYLIDKELH